MARDPQMEAIITRFLNAVFGVDVRQTIVDGFRYCMDKYDSAATSAQSASAAAALAESHASSAASAASRAETAASTAATSAGNAATSAQSAAQSASDAAVSAATAIARVDYVHAELVYNQSSNSFVDSVNGFSIPVVAFVANVGTYMSRAIRNANDVYRVEHVTYAGGDLPSMVQLKSEHVAAGSQGTTVCTVSVMTLTRNNPVPTIQKYTIGVTPIG